jgi:hypothetical protein
MALTIVLTVSSRSVRIEFKLSGCARIHVETAEIIDFADYVALSAKPGGKIGFNRYKDRLRSVRCDFEIPRRSLNLIVHPQYILP